MKYLSATFASATLFLLPLIAGAQTAPSSNGQITGNNLGTFLSSIIGFINSFVIPFIWAIAFVVFIWGIFQYFIAGGADEEKRSQGKQLMVWGVVAFFVMSSVWGIVNVLTGTFQFGNSNTPNYPTFEVKK